MTNTLFLEKSEQGWMSIGKFSDLSPFIDGRRELLEAIVQFGKLKASGQVTEEGFTIPDITVDGVTCVGVGNIVDIDFIPDAFFHVSSGESDGVVVVKCANLRN